MNAANRTVASPKLPGAIDTLGSAYRLVNRYPYLLALPLLLDLFYWLGPRLSVAPVAGRAVRAIEEVASSPSLGAAGSQSAQSLEMLRVSVEEIGQHLNLFSLVSSVLAIPSLLASQDLTVPAWLGNQQLDVSTPAGLVGLTLALFVLGTLAGALYLGLAALAVRQEQATPLQLVRRIAQAAGRVWSLVLLAVVAALLLLFPAAIVMTILSMIVSPALAGLIVLGVAFVAYLYLYFTLSALFVSDVGPLRAVRNSITVVRRFTSPALGLFLTIYIISMGIPYVWSALGSSDGATLVGIVGNAYVSTGLTVATMVFYRDRMAALRDEPPAGGTA